MMDYDNPDQIAAFFKPGVVLGVEGHEFTITHDGPYVRMTNPTHGELAHARFALAEKISRGQITMRLDTKMCVSCGTGLNTDGECPVDLFWKSECMNCDAEKRYCECN